MSSIDHRQGLGRLWNLIAGQDIQAAGRCERLGIEAKFIGKLSVQADELRR